MKTPLEKGGTIRVGVPMQRRLNRAARTQGKSVRQVLEDLFARPSIDPGDLLRRLEDLIIIQEAERQLADPQVKLVDHADVKRRLKERISESKSKNA